MAEAAVSSPAIRADEVVEQLRRAIRRQVEVKCYVSGYTWQDAYSRGNITFHVGEWLITFFNDCGDLDYVDKAVAPDGRTAEFDDWWTDDEEGSAEPIAQLQRSGEADALQEVLLAAR